MASVRGRPLAAVVAGFLLAGVAPAWVQSSPRQTAQPEAKKGAEDTLSKAAVTRGAPRATLPGQTSVLPPARSLSSQALDERSATPTEGQPRAQPAVPSSFGASPTQLNMVLTAPEQIGQVPGSFFWIRQGLQAARDPVDGALVFLSDDGRVLGRARLPIGFDIGQIVGEADQVHLIAEGRHIVLPRNVDPAATNTLQDAPVVGNGVTRQLRLTRRGPQQLILEDGRRTGARVIDVRSVTGGRLAQAFDVGPGTGEHRYIVSEEVVATKPALQVRMFVQRFDREGRLTGVVSVPLEGMDTVPRDFITVAGDGTVRALIPQSDGVKIKEFAFVPPPQGKRRSDTELKGLSRALREIPVDTNVRRPEGTNRFPRGNFARFKVDVPTPPISREQIVKNAAEYLSVNWVMAPENFSRAGIDNECVPTEAKFWRRPVRFTTASVGQTIGPMPYRWGGDDTPTTFKLRLEWGALAGSICTCRNPALDYCLSPESIGVDCSGLVSRAWGIEKRGTSGLLDVSIELDSLDDVKPGDAFDWPGRHIRLFTGNPSGAATAFTVIEASTRLECEGACMRTYRPSELNGYRIIRYRGVTE